MEGPEYVLSPYIPSTFEAVTEYNGGPIRIFKHKPTGLPVATVVGGHRGHIIGGIIYTRALDDSMNMEMETPMESMAFTMDFVESQLHETKSRDTIEGLWERFLKNLYGLLVQKQGFNKDGDPMPVLAVPIIDDEGETSPKKRTKEDADSPTECMICFERTADTTVIPCLHCVVCSVCSLQLKNTRDAKICSQCRRPIDGIFYPDNTMKEIE